MVHSSFVGFFVYPMLGLAVFSFAVTAGRLSKVVLRGHDFSFGIYLYHMPLVHFLLHQGVSNWLGMAVLISILVPISLASWFAVERPVLLRK